MRESACVASTTYGRNSAFCNARLSGGVACADGAAHDDKR